MNLEQIVKETIAKIVAEKKGKDLTGPNGKPDGKIDSADYLKARSNAIEKAKGLDEAANKIYITHKGPSDDPSSNYMQYDLTFNGDEINAEEYAKGWKVIRYDDWEDEWKDVRNPKKQEIIDFINAYNEKNSDSVNEGNLNKDHEVSMAQRSLDSILRAAMELKAKIGNQEIDIPAWIQDHITNSENYIDQASQGYHEYHNGGEHNEMDEARFKKGTDIGGKGFEFKDIAKKAAKQYGSKEAGQRVAGAVMKNVLNKEEASTPFKQGEAAHANRKHYTSNPYSVGSKEHDDFYNGWMNAETANQMAHDEFMFRKERGMDETRDPNSESDTPYYAVFDVHSQPYYIIAKSASEMLSRLNGYIRAKAETNPEYKFSYDMEDLQDDYYNGKLMPHVISDDFASVTKNAEEFKKDLSYYPNAIEYKGLNEDDAMLNDKEIIEKITGDKVETRGDGDISSEDEEEYSSPGTEYYSITNNNIFYTMEYKKIKRYDANGDNINKIIIKHDTNTNQKTPIEFRYDRNKKEYVKLAEELDEWTIRRMQHYAGIK